MSELAVDIPDKLRFLFEPHEYKVAKGGRSSGKSWSFARALLVLGTSSSKRIICVREVQESIKNSVHRLLSDQIKLMQLEDYYDVLDNEIRGRKNDTLITFSGLSTLTADSIKSFEGADICWIEEGQSISTKSLQILIPTIRKDGSEIWVTYNPDLDTDPIHQYFAINTPEDCIIVQVNYSDNPWHNEIQERKRLHCQKHYPKDYPNIWEGKCRPAAEGAIYYDEMQAAQDEGRICNVPYDPILKVHVVVDLGWNDTLSIAMVQRNLSEVRVIDYLEGDHKTLDWYSIQLKKREYNWGGVFLPHDGFSGNIASGGKTCADTFTALGWVVPGRESIIEVDVEGGIRLARMMLARTYFDKKKTGKLVEHLKRYKRSINRTTQTAGAPLHDEHSHGADCFRYIACNEGSMRNEMKRQRRIPPPVNWRVA